MCASRQTQRVNTSIALATKHHVQVKSKPSRKPSRKRKHPTAGESVYLHPTGTRKRLPVEALFRRSRPKLEEKIKPLKVALFICWGLVRLLYMPPEEKHYWLN
ncbi:unnamed protein product [Penicillium roqueforti FM164]|uniref:Genomic scaffold, ProqFM164S02 n=1 Tax=Penicillium roqueforti (strain FM164) TaxID=1365484 RepID=W6QTM7_PENRF|nr:unnamed protein product [Penicillium roqueforti FM164]